MNDRLKELLTEYVDILPAEINENTDIRTELGMDSLQLASFASCLETEFDITISDRDAMNIRTVGDVLALIGE